MTNGCMEMRSCAEAELLIVSFHLAVSLLLGGKVSVCFSSESQVAQGGGWSAIPRDSLDEA